MQGRKHHVASKCRLDGDLRRLEVAHLTDHDDVRVLAKERPQRRSEVQADLLAHLDLVDPHEVELDGILGGGDVLAGRVELRERGIECGRLARTRRAGDQYHPVRLMDALHEVVQLLLLESELGHVELQVRLVEEPKYDLLAEQRREYGDPIVHLLIAAHLQLDATVLWQTSLCDVELRHDLDARRERVAELAGRLHDFVQYAVDPVANTELPLVRLDVDVRCQLLDGIGQNQVDELDDGRVLGRLLQLGEVDVLGIDEVS